MHVDYSVPGVEEQLRFICTEAVGMGEHDTEVLRLTKRTENKSQTNYVAISYCWSAQPEETLESGGKVYVVTTPGGSTRDPRVHRPCCIAQCNILAARGYLSSGLIRNASNIKMRMMYGSSTSYAQNMPGANTQLVFCHSLGNLQNRFSASERFCKVWNSHTD